MAEPKKFKRDHQVTRHGLLSGEHQLATNTGNQKRDGFEDFSYLKLYLMHNLFIVEGAIEANGLSKKHNYGFHFIEEARAKFKEIASENKLKLVQPEQKSNPPHFVGGFFLRSNKVIYQRILLFKSSFNKRDPPKS